MLYWEGCNENGIEEEPPKGSRLQARWPNESHPRLFQAFHSSLGEDDRLKATRLCVGAEGNKIGKG